MSIYLITVRRDEESESEVIGYCNTYDDALLLKGYLLGAEDEYGPNPEYSIELVVLVSLKEWKEWNRMEKECKAYRFLVGAKTLRKNI